MKVIVLLFTLVFYLHAETPPPAPAAPSAPPEPAVEEPRLAKSHKFSGLRLKGQLKKPDLAYIYKRGGVRSEQIVDIPEDFDHELIQDADQF